ncbi:MAG: hypothetical protein Q4E57_02375 [Eubacteriales bacterium]|nr:hypothetical protein [Eubacteriales bacterium]
MLNLIKEYFRVQNEAPDAMSKNAVASAEFVDLYFRMSSGC